MLFSNSKLGAFNQDRRGAIAVVFAVALMVMCTVTGLAVDAARGYSIRTKLQNAADAAALSAARSFSMGNKDVEGNAKAFFKLDQPTTHLVEQIKVSAATDAKGQVTIHATADVPTSFMQLIGVDKLSIAVEAAVAAASGAAEIAIVLDTTGSMAGAKMDALKKSAHDLVTAIYEIPDAKQKIKVSVVPFAQYVNIGEENRNAPWMDVPLDYTKDVESCYTETPVISTSNCRMQTFSATNDGIPYTYQSQVCDYVYGPPVNRCTTSTWIYKWYGCAGSRDYPLNTRDDTYSTRVPGILNASCPGKLQTLTYDESKLHNAIDGMTAFGETYIPSGLIWGWRTLSSKAPFTESADDPITATQLKVKKYLVLMTDGANTKSPNYPAHDNGDAVEANRLTSELCNNIKGDQIDIFTITFDVTDNAIKNIMSSCASAGYYDVKDIAQLESAFKNIAGALTQLHLAK